MKCSLEGNENLHLNGQIHLASMYFIHIHLKHLFITRVTQRVFQVHILNTDINIYIHVLQFEIHFYFQEVFRLRILARHECKRIVLDSF